jgi:hypothetical protein
MGTLRSIVYVFIPAVTLLIISFNGSDQIHEDGTFERQSFLPASLSAKIAVSNALESQIGRRDLNVISNT